MAIQRLQIGERGAVGMGTLPNKICRNLKIYSKKNQGAMLPGSHVSCRTPRRPAISHEQGKLQTPEDGASTSAATLPCPQDGSSRMCHVIVLLCSDKMRPSAPEDGARARATASLVKLTRNTQAHPPAAGGQPLPRFEQHHAFLATLQPAIQLANPASQSYGGDVVPIGDTHPPPP